MMNPSLILLGALVLIIGGVVRAHNEWDLLIFTQNWPPTVCQHYQEEGDHHECARLKSDSWTVHGVWPTKLGTLGPGFCNSSNKFDPEQISFMLDELENGWPSIEADKGTTSLWSHEWEKHGTCAMQLQELSSEEKYFRKGLDWLYQYNMTSILKKNGIIPSNSKDYPVELFQYTILKAIGFNPHIECVFQKHTNKPFLLEIRICFDKKLQLVDCDGTKLSVRPLLTNCPVGSNIHYGTQVSNSAEPHNTGSRQFKMLKTIVEFLLFFYWFI